jgi:hypothetical protein
LQDRGLVQGAVRAEGELRDSLGQIAHGLFENAHVAAAGRDLAVPELIMQDQILLRPEHEHRLGAARPVVGDRGGVLVALHEGRVHIQGGRPYPRPALEARDQRAIGGVQARQGRGLQGDRRLGPGRPQRPALDVEGLQEVAHRGRGGQGVPDRVASA